MFKKRRRKYRKTEKENTKISEETKRGIFLIFLITFFLLSLLSLFHTAGRFGEWLLLWEKRFFGRGFFLFPVFLLLGIIFFLRNLKEKIKPLFYIAFALMVFSFYGLLHLTVPLSSSWQAAYFGQGGGYVGVVLSYPLLYFLSLWGALVILVAFFVVSLMLIFDFSFEDLFLKGLARGKDILLWLKDSLGKRRSFSNEEEEGGEIGGEEAEESDYTPHFSSEEVIPQKEIKGKQEKLKLKEAPSLKSIDLPVDLLEKNQERATSGDIEYNKKIIKKTLANFGIEVEMGEVSVGPSVTQYTLKPAEGIKLSKILSLNNDLSLALAAHPLRIEAPIPGKSLVGIEVPNKAVAKVRLRDIILSSEFKSRKSNLMVTLGKDVAGKVWMFDMSANPHLLIAGSTGTGKTICINSILISLLYQNQPDDLKLIIVDPKRVDLTVYNDIPYLLTPVITSVKETIAALRWAVGEMEERFEELSAAGARDIFSYHRKGGKMPSIVIVIDELADLMAAAGAEVEALIIRLAQMSRAVGIYLILATQRPSVNVITGLIKANITSRIAFAVASVVDSRTILDSGGAEKLLGRGDMLFVSSQVSKPKRLQGAFVSEKEVKDIVRYIKEHYGEPDYDQSVVERKNKLLSEDNSLEEDEEFLEAAKHLIVKHQRASASFLQRYLHIGYNRAARIIEILEKEGVVGPQDGSKPREILISKEDLSEESTQQESADENQED